MASPPTAQDEVPDQMLFTAWDTGGMSALLDQAQGLTSRSRHLLSENDDLGPVSVSQASTSFPDFKPNNPEIWFQQIEVYFRFAGIRKDGSKFYNVLNRLPEAVFERISVNLEQLPVDLDESQYEWVKKLLLKTYSKSDETKCSQILNLRQLGSSHPTVLLNEVKKLIPDHHKEHKCLGCGKVDILPPCPIAYTQYRSRLPQPIRRELPVKPKSWGQIAQEVEESWEAHYSLATAPATNSVAAVQQQPATEPLNEATVAAAQAQPAKPPKAVPRQDNAPLTVICKWHMQYGNDAHF